MVNRQAMRLLVRAAADILERILGSHSKPNSSDLPVDDWAELQRSHDRWQMALRRGWRHSATTLECEFHRVRRTLIQRLESTADIPRLARPAAVVPTLGGLVRDLVALQEEFESFDIDRRQRKLSARTDPIVLEGIHLGPFEIVLEWSHLDGSSPYHVLALDPCCADDASGTTHPHISHESLCEGEGQAAIRTALRQGRILDFFLLVRQILSTYNPASAYVPLERWNGVECRDCGVSAGSDDATTCEQCRADICVDCSSRCPDCEEVCCGGCRRECEECRCEYCARCLEICSACELEFCRECIIEGRCGPCRLEEQSIHDTNKTNPSTPETPTPAEFALHALCVGEAPVPA